MEPAAPLPAAKRPCGCAPSPMTAETAHLHGEDPCLRRVAEADLRGEEPAMPLCPDPDCSHHGAKPEGFRQGWAWFQHYVLLKEKLRDQASVPALLQPDGPAGTETLSMEDLSEMMRRELGEEPGGENLKKRLSKDRIQEGDPLWDLRQGGPYRHPGNGQVYRWAAEQVAARLRARRAAHRKAEEKRRRGEERILDAGVERHLRRGDF